MSSKLLIENTLPPVDGYSTLQKFEKVTKIPPITNEYEILAKNICSNDLNVQKETAKKYRCLLSGGLNNTKDVIQNVIDSKVLPRFVELMKRHDCPHLQFETIWALTNILSGTTEQCHHVVENFKIIPLLTELISSPNSDVSEQAVWALGNISGDGPDLRDSVLEAGAMQPLLNVLQNNPRLAAIRNGTWTLSNLCRGKPKPAFHLISPALTRLSQLLLLRDNEVLTDACWGLSYLSDGPNKHIAAVLKSGVAKRLVKLLSHQSDAVVMPALRCVGNIVSGNDQQTQIIINCEALSPLLSLISHTNSTIQKDALWTVSNITAGNSSQIRAVIAANIFPKLIETLASETICDNLKKEVLWALANASSGGTAEQVGTMVANHCIEPMCRMLNNKNASIVSVAIEGLTNIRKAKVQVTVSKVDSPLMFTNSSAEVRKHMNKSEIINWSNKSLHAGLLAVKTVLPGMYTHFGFRQNILDFLIERNFQKFCGLNFENRKKKVTKVKSESSLVVAGKKAVQKICCEKGETIIR
jgi:importin subunit alpha-1